MDVLVEQYIDLVNKQSIEQILAGGTLTSEREDEYIDQFEVLWWSMSSTQQEAVEAHLAKIPEPMTDVFVDVVVNQGDNNMPRVRII